MKIPVKKEWRKMLITEPEYVASIFREILKSEDQFDQDKEHVWVIGLNRRSGILYIDMVHLGTAGVCPAHPREIFRRAIAKGACSIIMAHNHPTGDPAFSQEDRKLTEQIAESGKIIGIRLLDHVVVCSDKYLSFAEIGLM